MMKKSMLDMLACPVDKHYPLQLLEINSEGDEVSEGIFVCEKCDRYYPIVEGIPVMLPDELRKRDSDLEFLQKWKGKIPEKVIKQGNPWHL